MKIEKVKWFKPANLHPSCIGIVLGVDELTGEKKGYIGLARGQDEEKDKLLIVAAGAPLTTTDIKEISAYLNGYGN